jgi:UDP-N-acetylglucosamine 4-epimerase
MVDRSGDVRHSRANVDKAQRLLGYQSKYMISEGLDETMGCYLESLAE